MNKKYSVESSTIVDRRTEILMSVVFNLAANKIINAKARTSDLLSNEVNAMGCLPTHHKTRKRLRMQS